MTASEESADAVRPARMNHARRMLSAYSGEHGVYGIVLVTALIAGEVEAETDDDVIAFVLGTVCVFWLAHVYAAVVASRGHRPAVPLGKAVGAGFRHSSGMVVAMLVPVALLSTWHFGVDEWVAYWSALCSGLVILAVIGYLNARRNGSTWPWRIAGVLATTFLGLIVIILSIAVH